LDDALRLVHWMLAAGIGSAPLSLFSALEEQGRVDEVRRLPYAGVRGPSMWLERRAWEQGDLRHMVTAAALFSSPEEVVARVIEQGRLREAIATLRSDPEPESTDRID
jgi:hypothetical protein